MSEAESFCFVISAPSGAGKTTLASGLLAGVERLQRTVSCTTRAARRGEQDGIDYFFMAPDEFARRESAGEFLETAEVHGNRYGTLHSEISRIHGAGDDAVMVIDVQGAESVRRTLPGAIGIFILPPSRDVLEARLRGRDQDDERARRALETRLGVAAHEIAQYVSYDYVIVNDDFDPAVAALVAVVRAERSRRQRQSAQAEAILDSFRAAGVAGAGGTRSPSDDQAPE